MGGGGRSFSGGGAGRVEQHPFPLEARLGELDVGDVHDAVEALHAVQEERHVLVGAAHLHLDRHLGVEVVQHFGLLPKERDLEPRLAPAGRDAVEQVGDLALVGQPGLRALQLGAQVAQLAFEGRARVGLAALAVELGTPLRHLGLEVRERALARTVEVGPVEHRDRQDDAAHDGDLLTGRPIEEVVEDHLVPPAPGLAAGFAAAPA